MTGAYVDSDYNLQPQNQVKVVVQEAKKTPRSKRPVGEKGLPKNSTTAAVVAIANSNAPAATAPDKKVKKPKVYGKTLSSTTSTTGDKETELPHQRPHVIKQFKILSDKRANNAGKKFVSINDIKAKRHSDALKSLSEPGQKIGDVLKKGAKEIATTISQGVKKVKSTYAASKAINSYSPKSDKSWSSKTSTPKTRKDTAPVWMVPNELVPKETTTPRKVADNPKKSSYDRMVARKSARAADPQSKSKGRNRGGKRSQGSTIVAATSESFRVIRPEEEQE